MAKSKVDEVQVDGAETVEVQVPVVKAFRFEVLAGTHYVGEVPAVQGEVIESDDDLVAIHGSNKFRRVE